MKYIPVENEVSGIIWFLLPHMLYTSHYSLVPISVIDSIRSVCCGALVLMSIFLYELRNIYQEIASVRRNRKPRNTQAHKARNFKGYWISYATLKYIFIKTSAGAVKSTWKFRKYFLSDYKAHRFENVEKCKMMINTVKWKENGKFPSGSEWMRLLNSTASFTTLLLTITLRTHLWNSHQIVYPDTLVLLLNGYRYRHTPVLHHLL